MRERAALPLILPIVLAGVGLAAPARGADVSIDLVPRQARWEPADAVEIDVVVRNDGDNACRIASAPWALALSLRAPDGQAVAPTLSRALLPNGFRDAIEPTLVEVPAHDAVTLELRGPPDLDDHAAIRTVSGFDDGSVLDALWRFRTNGTYSLSASLRRITVPGVDDLCTRSNSDTALVQIPEPGPAAGSLAVYAALAAFAWRRRRAARLRTAASLALLGAVALAPQSGKAMLKVDPPLQQAFDACIASFQANGLDTSAIDVLASSEKTYGVSASTTGTTSSNDAGNLYWDPNDSHDLGGGVPADACCALYHEMTHLREVDEKGQTDKGACFVGGTDTEIRNTEVDATRAENACRAASGLAQRDSYGGKPLPPADAECEDPPPPSPPPAPPPCAGRCGQSWGDPHLTTLDGVDYDFQAVGEFVLVQSTLDELRIHVRQRSLTPGARVAVNSAVAAQLGPAIVAIDARDRDATLLIDGTRSAVPEGTTSVSGGAAVERTGATYLLRWADGSTLRVSPSLHLRLELATSRAGALVGLLGDADGDPSNDFRTRGGEQIPGPPFTREALYDQFGASWRVSPAESLLPYQEGESTVDFTDLAFPDRIFGRDELGDTAAVESLCRERGVVLEASLAACVLDLALSGEADFAVASADAQALLGNSVFSARLGDRLVNAVAASARHVYAFDAVAGTPIELATATAAANGSTWSLLAPGGSALGGPVALDAGLGSFVLPQTGTYQVLIEGGALGTPYSVDLLARAPATAISMNIGASATGDLASGGRVTYQFRVTGRRFVYLRSDGAAADDRQWRLETPSGRVVAAGRLGADLGRLEVGENGFHRVVIEDPAAAAGSYAFTLIAAGDDVVTDLLELPGASAGSVPAAGRIFLRFPGTAGTTLTFHTETTTVDGRRWWLEDAEGVRLLPERGLWVDLGPVTLPADGTYVLGIGSIDESGGIYGWTSQTQ